MMTQTQHAQAVQSAREILRDVCEAAQIPDAIKCRARLVLQQFQPSRESKRAAAHSGLTWWLQLESAGVPAKEAAAAFQTQRHPRVWTAIGQTRTAVGKGCTQALVCFASDEHSMRDAFVERFGSHAANAATVFPGIVINDVTTSVITPDALRMVETLIDRSEPFSLEARLEYYRR